MKPFHSPKPDCADPAMVGGGAVREGGRGEGVQYQGSGPAVNACTSFFSLLSGYWWLASASISGKPMAKENNRKRTGDRGQSPSTSHCIE